MSIRYLSYSKKLIGVTISIILSIVMYTSYVSAESSDINLNSIAIDCGLGRDTFSFANFTYDFESDGMESIYNDFVNNCGNIEKQQSIYGSFFNSIESGNCFGISSLSVLAHNGVILPSEIQENANTLSEIELTEEVKNIIAGYSGAQAYHELDLAIGYNTCSISSEEQVEQLLDCANYCYKNDLYYLISFRGNDIVHAVTGIGIVCGDWTYNNKIYDTCILTYDSNAVDEYGNAVGFSDELCIYIDSDAKEFYIPGYDCGTETQGLITFSTYDSHLLNYNGLLGDIEPSVGENNVSQCVFYSGFNTDSLKMYSTDYNGEIHNVSEYIKNYFYGTLDSKIFYLPGVSYHIEDNSPSETNRFELSVWGSGYLSRFSVSNGTPFSADLSRQRVSIINKGENFSRIKIGLEYDDEHYTYSPMYYVMLFYELNPSETIEMMQRYDGILIRSSDGNIQGSLGLNFESDSDHTDTIIGITAAMDVLLTYDVQLGQEQFYLDLDSNGSYETMIEKGDANGDGKCNDLSDAMEILNAYANSAVGNAVYINTNICDLNGDDKISIDDAAVCLAIYAKNGAEINEQ